jgi:prevent-host-death family protein
MRTMTATDVARRFSAVLDAVERGEHILVTRGGARVAEITPTPLANGAAVRDVLRRHKPDPDFANDIESARSLLYIEDRHEPPAAA